MTNARATWFEDARRQNRLRPDGTIDGSFKGEVRLNRSPRWPPAKTYQEARDKSPSTRLVR